jgi:hypothetical protein
MDIKNQHNPQISWLLEGAPPDPRLSKACRLLLDSGFYEKDGGISYWKTWKQGECCVSGMLLSML